MERKTMKKAVIAIICLMLFCGSADAEDDSGYGLTLGIGQSQDNIDIYRVGLAKKWNPGMESPSQQPCKGCPKYFG